MTFPDVRDLFEADRALLLELVRDLGPADWERTTAAAPWRVRDVVAHLVGDDVNRLSRTRDGHRGPGPGPGEDLPAFVHRINGEWVSAAARLSPAVLASLLAATSPQILAMWRAMDLSATGEPVSWAGPGPAPVWLDCARDYTEYWVHRRQIAAATGRPDETAEDPRLLHAVLDTFLRAVPYTLARRGEAGDAGVLTLEVPGAGGGTWRWPAAADATVRLDTGTLWQLAVGMIDPGIAAGRAAGEGDGRVRGALFSIISIIR